MSEVKMSKNNNELIKEYVFSDHDVMLRVIGSAGQNLITIRKELGVNIGQRGNAVIVKGLSKSVSMTLNLIGQLDQACKKNKKLGKMDIIRSIQIMSDDPSTQLNNIFNDVVHVTASRRIVTPKGLAQKRYVDTIRNNSLTFGIGPAGTGKTYLAVAVAVNELISGRYKRIILTRPAVEAGEKLGFLPGDMIEKINPYVRPLYDALNDMLDNEKTQMLIAQEQIEIAPLAFMRGRTLNDAFVILDEAQNTTRAQMKMFLTRLGYSSKAVVTGDITQMDLPDKTMSGLIDAQTVLQGINGIGFCQFTSVDVVRHPLVQQIIAAYDKQILKEQPGFKAG